MAPAFPLGVNNHPPGSTMSQQRPGERSPVVTLPEAASRLVARLALPGSFSSQRSHLPIRTTG